MKVFTTIKDSDIGSIDIAPDKFIERKAARAIVFDKQNKVALLHSTKKHYHKLPGGGVEAGEDLETALRRELLEEIGCTINTVQELGIIEEYRNKFGLHQISYCFIARLEGEKGIPHLEEDEIAEGFVTEWLNLDIAIETLENEKGVEDYQGKFMQARDLLFLKECKKLK